MRGYLPAMRQDTQARSRYTCFRARPVNGALGAEVEGLDLSRELQPAVKRELEAALANHLVLFFRDQHIGPRRLAEIGRLFGELHVNPFGSGDPQCPEVMLVRSQENDTLRFAGKWHTDNSWEERPAAASLLYAARVPSEGGDTLFSNTYLAWQSLSPTLRGVLSGLQARHSAFRHHAAPARFGDPVRECVTHPVARTHPVTGRVALYVNEYFTLGFEGMSEEESQPLLDFLCARISQPDFCCRLRWKPGSLAIWDNRCTQHYATNDYPGQARLMHRVTTIGERPALSASPELGLPGGRARAGGLPVSTS